MNFEINTEFIRIIYIYIYKYKNSLQSKNGIKKSFAPKFINFWDNVF